MSILYIGGLPFVIFGIGLALGHVQFLPMLLVVVLPAVRSAFMGVWVSERHIIVVSWFRGWRVERDVVGKVVWRRYRGFFNRFQDDDNWTTWLWMLGFTIKGARTIRYFPSTISSRRRIERTAALVADRLEVRAVQASSQLV